MIMCNLFRVSSVFTVLLKRWLLRIYCTYFSGSDPRPWPQGVLSMHHWWLIILVMYIRTLCLIGQKEFCFILWHDRVNIKSYVWLLVHTSQHLICIVIILIMVQFTAWTSWYGSCSSIASDEDLDKTYLKQ